MARSGKPSWLKALLRSWFPAKHGRQRRRSVRLQLERLEDRITPNAYSVTMTGDGTSSATGGDGTQANPYQYATLVGAVNAAIADGQQDTITFASSLKGQTITLVSGANTAYGATALALTGSANITIDARPRRG